MPRPLLLCALLATLLCAPRVGADARPRWLVPYCPLIDGAARPLYGSSLLFTDSTELEGFAATSVYELDAHWDAAYYHGLFGGDLTLAGLLDYTVFSRSGGVGLPDDLLGLAVDLTWTRRDGRGDAQILGLTPGFYSEISGLDLGAVYVPARLAWVRTFQPTLTGVLGMDVRLGYDEPVFPYLGVIWAPAARLRVQAMLPESRLELHLFEDWTFYAGAAWQNRDYHLSDGRSRITIEDVRVFLGGRRRVTDNLYYGVELGEITNREWAFKRSTNPDLPAGYDVEDALYLRLAVSGPF